MDEYQELPDCDETEPVTRCPRCGHVVLLYTEPDIRPGFEGCRSARFLCSEGCDGYQELPVGMKLPTVWATIGRHLYIIYRVMRLTWVFK